MVRCLIISFAMLGLAGFTPVAAQKLKADVNRTSKPDFKFLNDISVDIPALPPEKLAMTAAPASPVKAEKKPDLFSEKTSRLQLKYAILMDARTEQVQNIELFEVIDNWMGTRYRYGGTTKKGIDCSAFVRELFLSGYEIVLPRTAREQYAATRRITREELREGDLVFFNTRGGVSHVGFYLQNNKFVHAATSEGVTISDLDETYWARRIIGYGRYEKPVDEQVDHTEMTPNEKG